MTNYPTAIDNDRTLIRVDDNLSELGSSAINQLREAVFSIEKTLGINPQGSKSSVNDRISILIGPDGNPRAEALQAIGLVTLPITNSQVAPNAGILESKLSLNYSTTSLNTNITALQSQLGIVQSLLTDEASNLLTHISGGTYLSDNTTRARHVASHIDLNTVPLDSRDIYIWTGLLDAHGTIRSATHVAEALLQINNELVNHEIATTTLVHPASAISIDASEFTELASNITNVQDAFGYIDNKETLSVGIDRATLNSNGIPRTARIQDLSRDGYTINVVPPTKIHAYLSEPTGLGQNDNINNGDDIIKFFPTNTNFEFDAKFTHVKVGDILRINYGNGLEAAYPIMAIRFSTGTEWAVRVNANNLFDAGDGYDGYARIDRPNFDRNTWGCYAAAGVVPNVIANQASVNSLILGSPRGAVAVGIGFDPNKVTTSHYRLYLRLYPTGNPSVFSDLPAIDVSGNGGTTPGHYTLDMIVEATNRKFRASGYNYRFIAFNHKGEFGIMLADSYNGAAFSIVSAQVNATTGVLETGPYTLNVVGDVVDGLDALGLGISRAGFATPVMSRGGTNVPYPTSITAANYSTLIIYPVTGRNTIVNGTRRDSFAKPRFTEGDGYWRAIVSNINPDPTNNTIRVTYSIDLDLATENLAPGKTIVLQPVTTSNVIKDYGRFIIDDISFSCAGSGRTNITVLNAIHGSTNPNLTTLAVNDHVNIYFSDDSVMFNMGNMNGSDGSNDPDDYHHYHEVFVNNVGKSVAVERARIPHSNTGTIPALAGFNNIGALAGWRIRKVSSKLNGYISGINYFRHFIWLRVNNYNTTTGEFDIYLFNLDWSIGSSGPIARGKKNHPVKVYDESYVNFIEIELREDTASPGTTVPTGWVAVELFPSLSDNDEYFPVAGVSHNGRDFQSVTNLREFGTISETNFSDSAMKFIQSGERYLHANGIVRGFAWRWFVGSNYTLSFNGGMALVNGAFVAVDALTVTIPILTGPSDVVEHFICVTETGQLISILKNTGTQFFDGTHSNFVESLTFKEIIDTRKDLTIIAKASVTTSTSTVVVTDARRHIANQDLQTYSWSYTDRESFYSIDNSNPDVASFITAEALMNWVNEYNIREVTVKNVFIDQKLTLSFTSPVVLKGGIYNINNTKGLAFESGNWKIDNADFIYLPNIGGTFDTGDRFNIKDNWAAVLMDFGSILNATISDFGIENSRFHSSLAQRPPFVGIYSATGNSYNVFKNGRFVNNTFTDTLAGTALCYAFINGNSPNVSVYSPYFEDILVSDTKIDKQQSILISGRAIPNTTGPGYTSMNSVLVENFVIKDNEFGLIGFNVNNWIRDNESGRFIIHHNKAEVIYSGVAATMHPSDLTFSDLTHYTTGNSISYVVTENECYYMKIEASAGSNQLKSHISGNTIQRRSDTLHAALVPDAVPWALVVCNQGLYPTNVSISDNIIDGLDSGYRHNIYVTGAGASITGNTVNNIAAAGYGIWNIGTTLLEQSTIVGNTLNKQDGVVIAGYIYSSANSAIYGNNFSHFNLAFWSNGGTDYFDGYGDTTTSSFNGITGPGAQFAAWNINQVVRTVPNLASAIPLYHITPSTGVVVTSSENDERLLYGPTASLNRGLHKVSFHENDGWLWEWSGIGLDYNDGTVGLIIPLSSVLPDRAYLLSLSITVVFNCTWAIDQNAAISFPNTFPQVSLELNGNMVDSANPVYPEFRNTIVLNYHSDALVTGRRPEAPLIKEMVVKIKQGVINPNTVIFGGWVGPTQPSATLRIRQPWITYMY